jgi:Zinc finger, ZZ type
VQLFTVVQQERAAAKEAVALAETAAKAAAVKAAAAAAAVPVRRSPARRASANPIEELFNAARRSPATRVTMPEEQHEAIQEPAAVHRGVRCDVCNILPIVGVRYKCAVREVCIELYLISISTSTLSTLLLDMSFWPASIALLSRCLCRPPVLTSVLTFVSY